MVIDGTLELMIEKHYDVPFVANLARREKQIQQNYRPIIAVHKWFARRPGTLFRALMLSEFSDLPLQDAFYQTGNLQGKTIADPFMGGGTPLLEANRMGADVLGRDINPMSYWIVRQEMEHLDLDAYQMASGKLRAALEEDIGHLYRTKCEKCGADDASVKYFLWVKTIPCKGCGKILDLFPGYLVAEDIRHPQNVFVCPGCGKLTETPNRKHPGLCQHCNAHLLTAGPARRNGCTCPKCETRNSYPNGAQAPMEHRLFALEYHCRHCKTDHKGRFFKTPDKRDLANVIESETRLARLQTKFIPEDRIPEGDETTRLHRWHYHSYRELFNNRQLLGLELSCRHIAEQRDERVRNALATNLSDLLRYQNMLCRYDSMALKSLDIFSVHGFPVGLIQCESNLLGIANGGGVPVGSGGWLNIVEKYTKAKIYCDSPFEVRVNGARKEVVPITGEWIGDTRNGSPKRLLDIACSDSAAQSWLENSLDAVFTDPPYFGNVQYAELMDFCYVWLRRLVGTGDPAFALESTRQHRELTGNVTMGRGIFEFTEGLAKAYANAASALKPGAPFVFTYHHNDITAYFPVAVAILDAGLVCPVVLPCPAEMGASIHINGTNSSTVDSVFVCRLKKDKPPLATKPLLQAVANDLEQLHRSGLKVTSGDVYCVLYGNLIRIAVNSLAYNWSQANETEDKLGRVSQWFTDFGGQSALLKIVAALINHTADTMHSSGDLIGKGILNEAISL